MSVCDVWWLVPEAAIPAGADRILSPEDRDEVGRLYFEIDRSERTAARILTRLVLSQYAPVPPAEWRFRRNRFGRPAIELPQAAIADFNVSHTRGMIVCAVSRRGRVGVDVERVREDLALAPLISLSLTAQEGEAVRAMPADAQPAAFFQYWTLKEAYAKAIGHGLSLPFTEVAFRPPAPGPHATVVDRLAAPPGEHAGWLCVSLPFGSEHQGALAVEGGASLAEVRVRGGQELLDAHVRACRDIQSPA